MPTVVAIPPPPSPPRKLWTREDVAALDAAGLLNGERLELIEGELIKKMPKTRPHSIGLDSLANWLRQVFGLAFVEQEVPINVAPEDNPTSEPEPDIIVLKSEYSSFVSANPGPQDLPLVVEVAYSTLDFDLTTKANLYARAGIPEYWVLDVAGRRLVVHRDPQSRQYTSVIAFSEQESVALLAAPSAEFRVRDAFPPRT
jgi:Uma2 family endonuclease